MYFCLGMNKGGMKLLRDLMNWEKNGDVNVYFSILIL